MTRGHDQDQISPVPASRWETFVWPRWLPVRARLPIIAQLAAVAILIAIFIDPRWWSVKSWAPTPGTAPVAASGAAPTAPTTPQAPAAPSRPAHLNLDVRHTFGKADLTVHVDGKRALQTTLEGNGKRFGMFGKRSERIFLRTLDLQPGARVVMVRLRSSEDKFDQSQVEKFDLDPAAVATIRVSGDKEAGLQMAVNRPAPAPPVPASPVAASVVALPAAAPMVEAAVAPQAADVIIAELFSTLRSILIALAGFIGSAATGFVVQEFMRRRKDKLFDEPAPQRRAPNVRIAAE